jgi:cation transport ATPase
MSTSGKATSSVPIRRVTLSLHSLNCASDAQTVERILKEAPGVVAVYANPASEKVYIEYNSAHTDPSQLQALLQAAGYGQQTLQVTCGRCRHSLGDRSTAARRQLKPVVRWWSRWWQNRIG